MKKINEIAIHILIGFFVILAQIYIFDNIAFFGAKFDIILVHICIVSIFKGMKWSVGPSIALGSVIDIIFNAPPFKYIAIYLFLSIIINIIISKYRKESKLAAIYIVGIATIIFGIIEYIFYVINKGIFVNVFSFLGMVFLSIVVNVILFAIANKIYKMLAVEQKFSK